MNYYLQDTAGKKSYSSRRVSGLGTIIKSDSKNEHIVQQRESENRFIGILLLHTGSKGSTTHCNFV